MDLAHAIKETALNLCNNYVSSQSAHDEKCKDQQCRLRQRPKRPALVAASVVKLALRKSGDGELDRQFQEFAELLREQDVDAFRTEIGKIFKVISDHINAFDQGYRYTCTGDAVGIVTEGDSSENFLSSITALMPRLCGQLKLPYLVQNKALELYKQWAKAGVMGSTPQTIAAGVIQAAVEDTHLAMAQSGIAQIHVVKGQVIPGLSDAAGVAPSTILKAHKEFREQAARTAQAGGSADSAEVKTER